MEIAVKLARKDEEIAEQLASKETEISERLASKDAETSERLATKDTEIAELRDLIEKSDIYKPIAQQVKDMKGELLTTLTYKGSIAELLKKAY